MCDIETLTEDEQGDEDVKMVEALWKELVGSNPSERVKPPRAIVFEKDNDENHHIDFLTASSNMRAFNYHVKPASRHQVKITTGRF